MAIYTEKVDSSFISEASLDTKKRRMTVKFKRDGSTWVYFRVTKVTFSAFLTAESKGRFLNDEIKMKHRQIQVF